MKTLDDGRDLLSRRAGAAMDGVGHRAFLYAPPAMRAAVAFFDSPARYCSRSSSRGCSHEAVGTMVQEQRGLADRVTDMRGKLLRM